MPDPTQPNVSLNGLDSGPLPLAPSPPADTHLTAVEIARLCEAMFDSDPDAIDNNLVHDWCTDIVCHIERLLQSRGLS